MSLPKVLKLEAQNVEIDGYANDLTVKVKAYRAPGKRSQSRNYEHVELQLHLYRCGVTRLLEQLAAMHDRDRERIAVELRRIEREKAILGKGVA